MATTIRIDPDDELPAILERLPVGGSCILVLPPSARALNGAVGAKLLARRAEALDTRVAVVSDDSAVIAHVHAAGIPVAQTVEEAQRLLPPLPPSRDASVSTANDEVTLFAPRPRPVVPPPGAPHPRNGASDARPARDAGSTAPDDAGVPLRRDETMTIVAGETAGMDEDDARRETQEPPAAIRGHSGGARAARGRGRRIVPPPDTEEPARAQVPPRPAATRPRPRRSRPADAAPTGLRRLLVPAVAVLVVLLLLAWLLSSILGGLANPAATVTLQMRPGIVTGPAVVHAIPNLPAARRDATHIPATKANQPEQTSIAGIPVNGRRPLPGHIATGYVDLANMTGKPLLVPAGTTFTTALGRQTFVSVAAITLPPAKIAFTGTQYGTGRVGVRAAIGGSAGNVPRDAILYPSALFTGALNVKNPDATRGGTDVIERFVTPSDAATAATNAFAALERKARADIAHAYGSDLEQHTLFIARSPVAPRLSSDQKSATLSVSIVLHDIFVHKGDLRPAAEDALAAASQSGAPLIASSVTWTATWRADNNTIDLATIGHTVAPLDVVALKRALQGRPIDDARAYLRGQTDIASTPQPHIDLSPAWADHVPDDPSRIIVDVRQPH